MRKNMNLKYGQKKKVDKTIGMDRRDKVETFWVPLYHAERFWSNAMELKVEIPKSKKPRALRVNIKKKLKRSIDWMNVF